MEVEVLHHEGLPENGVLSIRAGGTRRQVQLREIDRPLRFPGAPEEGSFKVDVMDLVGSSRLAYTPSESMYNLILEQPDGEISANRMELHFSVRQAGDGGGAEGDLSQSPAKAAGGGGPLTPEEERALDARKEQAGRDYLEQHGITAFMQFLVQSLMKDKPADPYAFLQKQVTKRMVTESARALSSSATLEQARWQKSAGPPSPNGAGEAVVTLGADQLAKLEQDASAASAQLREDNRKLQEMAQSLRIRYSQLCGEPIVVPEQEAAETAPLAVSTKESPQLAAYRDIAMLQDDITMLAKENSKLVGELSQMRSALDDVSREIVAAGETVISTA